MARLDSAFELNDPYAGFERPAAPVAVTPPVIRERFAQDLWSMFGADAAAKARLDSGQEIIVFTQQLGPSLYSYVLHVADIVAGDRYFVCLKERDNISPNSWSWYGPAADSGAGPRFPRQTMLAVADFPGVLKLRCLSLSEWRHNGSTYYAWVRSFLSIEYDLSLKPHFRFEPYSNSPFESDDRYITRFFRQQDFLSGDLAVHAELGSGRFERSLGTVFLRQSGDPGQAGWQISGRRAEDARYEKLLLTANPRGDPALLSANWGK